MQQKQLNTPDDSVEQVTFWQAFLFWLKLGFISFGGPAGQIAVMHQELVEQKRWISEKRFLHALNYCMLLPGPEAQQLATYIGWLMHRTAGGLVAGILFVLPSLFILIGLSWVYIKFGDVPVIAGIFYGIKPAVTAIVFHATYRIGSRSLKNKFLWVVAIAAFFAIFVLKLPFPLIVLSAGIAGYLASKKYPELFSSAGGHKASQKDYGPAYIDDDTPTPEHAKFHWSRLARLIFVAIALWLLPILALGAYFGWLSPTQMIDGLALGETTPGPLIMVVAFVGFLGGVNHSLLGSEHLFFAGALGAVIVTWFTFLFSFVFIFAGAPIIESTHNEIKFTAPLTAITAAVVGVILNLALFFSYHVLWPQGFSGHFDIVATLITVAAFIALFRFSINVLYVIFASALVGLAVTFF
ncbi:chromate efflux transporter [Acinetobacter baumannii]|nr:chromate efflux transporter [Acinetobacter baumannii]